MQHSCCNLSLLERRHTTNTTLQQHCNAGVKLTNQMGWVDAFKFWENKGSIPNLLLFALMEKQGYEFAYKTGGEWAAYILDGGRIHFKLDKGICN